MSILRCPSGGVNDPNGSVGPIRRYGRFAGYREPILKRPTRPTPTPADHEQHHGLRGVPTVHTAPRVRPPHPAARPTEASWAKFSAVTGLFSKDGPNRP